ncbi:hypothetical protein AJ80_02692 [Polytolypa hystricis UAMH7299]|uniref:HD/PDEase domain-containing protein n=1 Tax=Polytolypa hystricis (strain UAMH7299) TaxID=1447883 RepID=A0A2B7YNQ0_POLH7|nr:hypothetical protein AJ80_02692 [Polytolypa hystricis UAMH7299]
MATPQDTVNLPPGSKHPPTHPSDDAATLIARMEQYVTEQMSGHDPSHNPQHVTRVVRLAHRILDAERARDPQGPAAQYDKTVVTLSAILHDIGDRKYLPKQPSSSSSPATPPLITPQNIIYHVLLNNGASQHLAQTVQTIVTHVSYTTETKNPEKIQHLIDTDFPELAIVQDADRLDALGAMGIARCFTYLGAKGGGGGADRASVGVRASAGTQDDDDGVKLNGGEEEKNAVGRWELDEGIEHFGEKLEKLEGMMKTQTGREMARERSWRLQEFRRWWEEETTLGAN